MTDDAASRLARLRARAEAALAGEAGFDKRVALDFGADGALLVDGPAGAVALAVDDRPLDCRVAVSLDDFIALARGALDPAKAFLKGRIRIEGDMALALDLAKRLRDAGED